MDETWKYIISIAIMVSSPPIYDFFKKWINKQREIREQAKLISESKNLDSQSRKADAETITERALADKTYVETMNLTMESQKKLFEDRVLLLEKRQQENIELAEKRQQEITKMLDDMKIKNDKMEEENKKIKEENWQAHQENLKLTGTIAKLQSAIKGLKKLIERLLGGINKLISAYEEDHKNGVIPWKPILTDEEQLLLQSDFDELGNNYPYR